MDTKEAQALRYAEKAGRGREAKELIRTLQLEKDAAAAHLERRSKADALMDALTDGDRFSSLSLQQIGDLGSIPKQTIKNRVERHRKQAKAEAVAE